jgi:hypothetical protein
MNLRIRELAEQAEFSEKDLHIQGDNFQKFAELIVKECADIAMHNVMNISTYADADFVDAQIKKHFEVEE